MSKLDPSKATITEWLEKDATVSGAVIQQRLQPLGYTGGPTILRAYLHGIRPKSEPARAFVRVEPAPGDYVANILRQQQAPRRPQPPLVLRDPLLNELASDPLSLIEYDAFILHPNRKESDDSTPTEAESTEPVHHEPPTGDDSD